jgi:hypothetical protein
MDAYLWCRSTPHENQVESELWQTSVLPDSGSLQEPKVPFFFSPAKKSKIIETSKAEARPRRGV